MKIEGFNFSCEDIARAVNGELKGKNCKINCITTDSREKCSFPSCFFAIKGEKFNGNDHIAEAMENGAMVIVTDEKIGCGCAVIRVEDTRRALGLLAKAHIGSTRVIGVTGSQGKTTVKDMIISVLREKYSVCGTVSNQNNEIGVALTLLGSKNEDFCVVEMGMRGCGEIEWLSYISEPEIAVVTNCGTAHIGRLGSENGIFLAKMEILKHTKSVSILPYEERFLNFDSGKLRKIYFGENAQYNYGNFQLFGGGQRFTINGNECILNSIYEHDAKNATIAFAVGEICGLKPGEISSGLSKYVKAHNRGSSEVVGGLEIINDCYNASYESTKSAILNCYNYCKTKGKRLALLLGDMLELGEHTEELHKKIGELCKELGIEKTFVFGAFSSCYLAGHSKGIACENFNEIASIVLKEISDEYVLLVKASNAINFEKIVNDIREIKNA